MYKVLTYLDNELGKIEAELNSNAYEIVHVWNNNSRVIFIVKTLVVPVDILMTSSEEEKPKRGRKRIEEGN